MNETENKGRNKRTFLKCSPARYIFWISLYVLLIIVQIAVVVAFNRFFIENYWANVLAICVFIGVVSAVGGYTVGLTYNRFVGTVIVLIPIALMAITAVVMLFAQGYVEHWFRLHLLLLKLLRYTTHALDKIDCRKAPPQIFTAAAFLICPLIRTTFLSLLLINKTVCVKI